MTEPSGYTALDLIGFTDQGTYDATASYVKNDLVHYYGVWRCLVDDTTGITPVEGTNWTLFVGEPTSTIEGIIAPIETNPATDSYAVGRQFIYNDALYEVIVAITAGDALVAYEDDPDNANIQLADPVETQLLDFEETAYATDDTTETDLASDDLVPFYDTSAAAKRQMTVANMIGQTVSNPNLLDNPWFTVNQRGESSYTEYGANVYCYDRWLAINLSNTALTYDDENGIVATADSTAPAAHPYISQLLEKTRFRIGDTYTFSMLVKSSTNNSVYLQIRDADGNTLITSGSKTVTADTWTLITVTGTLTTESDYYQLRVYFNYSKEASNIFYIRAVKIEVGSVSTLALDAPPNYQQELAKCQRYYHIYATESLRPSNMYDCVPVMASTPSQGTITIDDTTYYYNSADL